MEQGSRHLSDGSSGSATFRERVTNPFIFLSSFTASDTTGL